MDLTSLIGICAGFACIIISILLGGEVSTFINIPSIFIVIGGTFSATVVSFFKENTLN